MTIISLEAFQTISINNYIVIFFLIVISILFLVSFRLLKTEFKKKSLMRNPHINDAEIAYTLYMFAYGPTLILLGLYVLLKTKIADKIIFFLFNLFAIFLFVIFYVMQSKLPIRMLHKIIVYLGLLIYIFLWFFIIIFLR